MKRGRILLGLIAVLLVAGTIGGIWLLRSESGLRFAIARAQSALPGLQIGSVTGMIGTQVVLQDLSYRSETVEVFIAHADADFELSALLFGGIDLERLHLRDVRVRLLPAAVDASKDTSPSASFPSVRVSDLQIAGLTLERPVDAPMQWVSVKAGVALSGQTITLDALSLEHLDYLATGSTRLLIDSPWLLGASDLSVRSSATAQQAFAVQLKRAAGSATPIDIQMAQPMQARIRVQPGRDFAYADIAIDAPEQDAAAIGLAGKQVAINLHLSRKAATIVASGSLSLDGYHAQIDAGNFRLLEQGLQIDALPVVLADIGRIDLQGIVPFGDAVPLQLTARTESITWTMPEQAPLQISGTLQANGSYADLQLQPDLQLLQQGLPPGKLDGSVTITDAAVDFDALRLQLPRGALSIDGALARDEAAQAELQLTLDAFDPSLFVAELPGALSGSAHWIGAWTDQGAQGTLKIAKIDGQLRGLPFALQGSADIAANVPHAADAELRFGSARAHVDGDISGASPLQVTVDVPDLSVLDAKAGGQLQLSAARDQRWQIDAQATALVWHDYRLDSLRIKGALGSDRNAPVDLTAALTQASTGTITIDTVAMAVKGTLSEHAISAQLSNVQASISTSVTGSWQNEQWSGVIDRFDLGLDNDRQLHLQQPVMAVFGAGVGKLDNACLSGNDNTRVCVMANHANGAGEASVDVSALPLAWISGWTDAPEYSLQDAILHGTADASWRDMQLISAKMNLQSGQGRLLVRDRPDLLLGYRSLLLDGAFSDGKGVAQLSADLLPEGRIEARFDLGRDAHNAFSYDGNVSLLVRQLDAIEAFTTEIANPEGLLTGQFRLQQDEAGFRAGGALALSNFKAEIPSLGLKLENGSVAIAGVPEGLILRAAVKSGDGTLTVDGKWSQDDDGGLALRINGDNVRLSNTPELSLYATPKLELKRDSKGWDLSGTVDIPRARIQADQFTTGATTSPDVVIIDDPEPAEVSERWRARVQVRMGDDVQLKGFGFDGKLQGQIAVSQASGRSATATGQLNVVGNYNAYGQKLTVESGGLFFAGSPLDEPALRVRAERKIGDSTAGIEITGTARRPVSRVYARPAMSESEALALLVTGRSLRDVRGGDRSQLSGAALALGTIGGDMLAKNLGLDELGVSSNSGVQGEAFTIGKYLSPRLYIGYGIGLLTRGEVFTVRYMINQRINVEANIGERQRAAVNYRIER